MASNIAIRLGAVAVLGVGGFIYSQVAGGGARVREAESMADEGCACKTTACADTVSQKFSAWIDKHGEESVDTSDVDKAAAAFERFTACADRLVVETSPVLDVPPAKDEPAEAPPAELTNAPPSAKKKK